MDEPTGNLENIKPAPGTLEAEKLGCTCPVLDNGHGRGIPGSHGRHFWITGGCPIHASLIDMNGVEENAELEKSQKA